MSYSVTAYLTNSADIVKLHGSKNNNLLAVLLDELSEQLGNLNDDFDFDPNIGRDKNSQEVLRDIINGEIRFPEIAYLYGYVYEKLCQHYGAQVGPPNEEFSTNYYWAVPKQTYKAFIAIPFSSDFPEIFSIPVNDLPGEKERFLGLSERKGADEEYLKMEKEDFEFAFDKAIEEKKDLVFFLY